MEAHTHTHIYQLLKGNEQQRHFPLKEMGKGAGVGDTGGNEASEAKP